MATVVADRGAATFPKASTVGGGVVHFARGTYTFTANPTAADIIHFCRVPPRATVFGGFIQGADIDTGTDALDIDIGWAANGVEAADPDGFGNMGVLNGAAITNLKPETGIYRPLGGVLFSTGAQFFTNETIITGTVIAAANAGGTGILHVCVFYHMGP